MYPLMYSENASKWHWRDTSVSQFETFHSITCCVFQTTQVIPWSELVYSISVAIWESIERGYPLLVDGLSPMLNIKMVGKANLLMGEWAQLYSMYADHGKDIKHLTALVFINKQKYKKIHSTVSIKSFAGQRKEL